MTTALRQDETAARDALVRGVELARLEEEVRQLSLDLAADTIKAKHRRRAECYMLLQKNGYKREAIAGLAGVTPKAVDWAVVSYKRQLARGSPGPDRRTCKQCGLDGSRVEIARDGVCADCTLVTATNGA